jgi:hypothetical protein
MASKYERETQAKAVRLVLRLPERVHGVTRPRLSLGLSDNGVDCLPSSRHSPDVGARSTYS